MQLEEWMRSRIYSYKQFADVDVLINKKARQKNAVSLCLPALNESPTIGKIIKSLKKDLYDRKHLIDEIIVIDSGSTDGTPEIARKLGARVYEDRQILPEMGIIHGKGENLWKSLYLANGDIILWLDTDIRNMDRRFVTGLVGPLLQSPEIAFVKGFYRRPITIGKKVLAAGGGRVTEILVKPFFNLLFPQLALFNQPLSGEYGGRRELLERVPFFTGYGVETGLMIDIEDRFGLGCMAQVDLKVRIHRNQDLDSLRKMAFGILKVLMTRAEQQGKLILMDNVGNQITSMLKNEFGQFDLHVADIQEIERPPMILCEAYQKKRSLTEENLILIEEVQKKRGFPFLSICPLLRPALIVLDGKAENKDQLFKEISSLLVDNKNATDYPRLVQEFHTRENALSTGTGSGVAIPHVLSSNIKRMQIVVYRKSNSLAFDSMDGQPVNLIFAVVAPAERRGQYLQVLANLARILKDGELKKHLLNVATPEDFISVLRKIEAVKQIEQELRAIES